MKKLTQYLLAAIVGLTLGTVAANCAHTTPGTFTNAVVTCTMENSNNAQASAAVVNCLVGAAVGNYTACLSGLVSAGHWTVDEVACIVRRLATESAQRLNAGTSTDSDRVTLDNANKFLRDNSIKFR